MWPLFQALFWRFFVGQLWYGWWRSFKSMGGYAEEQEIRGRTPIVPTQQIWVNTYQRNLPVPIVYGTMRTWPPVMWMGRVKTDIMEYRGRVSKVAWPFGFLTGPQITFKSQPGVYIKTGERHEIGVALVATEGKMAGVQTAYIDNKDITEYEGVYWDEYLGTMTQNAAPEVVADLGYMAPTYRNTAYVLLKGIVSSVPQLPTFSLVVNGIDTEYARESTLSGTIVAGPVPGQGIGVNTWIPQIWDDSRKRFYYAYSRWADVQIRLGSCDADGGNIVSSTVGNTGLQRLQGMGSRGDTVSLFWTRNPTNRRISYINKSTLSVTTTATNAAPNDDSAVACVDEGNTGFAFIPHAGTLYASKNAAGVWGAWANTGAVAGATENIYAAINTEGNRIAVAHLHAGKLKVSSCDTDLGNVSETDTGITSGVNINFGICYSPGLDRFAVMMIPLSSGVPTLLQLSGTAGGIISVVPIASADAITHGIIPYQTNRYQIFTACPKQIGGNSYHQVPVNGYRFGLVDQNGVLDSYLSGPYANELTSTPDGVFFAENKWRGVMTDWPGGAATNAKVIWYRQGLSTSGGNNALCLYDLLTHTRYGGGCLSSNVNLESFVSCASYCDEEVTIASGTEPRFRLGIEIGRQQESLIDAASLLLTTYRAALIWSDGQYKNIIERDVGTSFYFNNYYVIQGTADSGTVTTLVDSVLDQGPRFWLGDTLEITGGTNAGLSRPVIGFSDTIVEVYPAFPAAIDNTSTYRIVKANIKKFKWAEIKDIPNQIKIEYHDRDDKYRLTHIQVDDYYDQDVTDEVRSRTFLIRGITRTTEAQRMGQVMLENLAVTKLGAVLETDIRGLCLDLGDVISVRSDTLPWDSILWRILDIQEIEGYRFRFLLVQYNAAIYQDRLAGTTAYKSPDAYGTQWSAPTQVVRINAYEDNTLWENKIPVRVTFNVPSANTSTWFLYAGIFKRLSGTVDWNMVGNSCYDTPSVLISGSVSTNTATLAFRSPLGSGFPGDGVLYVNEEEIYFGSYNETSGTFTECVRGFNSTVAGTYTDGELAILKTYCFRDRCSLDSIDNTYHYKAIATSVKGIEATSTNALSCSIAISGKAFKPLAVSSLELNHQRGGTTLVANATATLTWKGVSKQYGYGRFPYGATSDFIYMAYGLGEDEWLKNELNRRQGFKIEVLSSDGVILTTDFVAGNDIQSYSFVAGSDPDLTFKIYQVGKRGVIGLPATLICNS